jgi:2'-5' RNA ligase
MRNNDEVLSDDYVALAAAIGNRQYTGLGADYQKQIESFRGWNFVAISTICRISARAEPRVYDDRINTISKSFLRSRRDNIVSQSKSWAEYNHGSETADPSFRWWQLVNQPNPWQTGSHFRWDILQQLRLHGIAMVWNARNAAGKTIWRIPMPMSLLTPIPPGYRKDMPFGAVRVHTLQWIGYHFGIAASLRGQYQTLADREISLDDITMYSYPNPLLRGDGFSPSSAGQAWHDIMRKSEDAQSNQFGFGARQRVLVQPPSGENNGPSELDAYQRRLDKRITESQNGVVVAPHGSVTPISLDADEMGYSSTSDTLSPAILALHGVSKAAAGLSEGMTYGSVANAIRQTILLSVQPDMDLIADQDTATMVQEEGSAFWVEYPVPPVDDAELEITRDGNELEAKAMTVKEWRIKQGREPYGDERDDMTVGDPALATWKPKPKQSLSIFSGMAKSQTKSMMTDDAMYRDRPGAVVAFDLDGTLAEYKAFDESKIGQPKQGMVEVVRNLKAAGCGIVIYTARDNDTLVATWLNAHSIPFDAINMNPWAPETSAKMMADVYVDDRAVSGIGNEAIIMESIVSSIDDPAIQQTIRQTIKRTHFDRRFGFLFLPVSGELLSLVKSLQSRIKPEHLGKSGMELEPHITVLYGVLGVEPFEAVTKLRMVRKPSFTIVDQLAAFGEANAPEKAIGIQLSGEDLQSLYAVCSGSFPHVGAWPVYRPHITLGYVRSEFAGLYEGMTTDFGNRMAVADRIVFRDPVAADTVIPLS